ncbi:bifunctional tetrahydrofolate synthase/dihydrofolate synthase [Pokkaliibacter plantistimulans]|uniref:Dihydrofolate synthase/folylpolyglutamate synthase n=1 Tax=Proteobacteria bacterium 228 TaxID=2083153 RepID=A0A2S5KQV8_9PROT|nr:bifunctional tetrahydrofolate synthase/dihydrofolate synthase [Pokkaliibacter plantistimulans]PPC77231.1 bifunctional tetrahydrofolate synthase/dihydrofolate synthase [Pokkaliibacter plantistimulans]
MTQRTLNDWLAWMEQQHPSAIDLGLDRVQKVWQALGAPQPAKKVVVVGGTNGKGSTLTYISQLAMTAGWKTGTYTSPHFLRYNERVAIEGKSVADGQLCAVFERIEACQTALSQQGEVISLTYFEFGTLAALLLLAGANLDLAVLEVGLGGRLDAVNIVSGDVAIVTSVDLDHTDWLGSDREAIGFEKAGIFRPDRLALCAEPDVPQSLAEHAQTIAARLMKIGESFGIDEGNGDYRCYGQLPDGRPWYVDHIPAPQLPVRNMAPALQAVKWLGIELTDEQCRHALSHATLTGRFQHMEWQNRHWLLDVAHNPEAARHLAKWLARNAKGRKVHALCGMLADKDIEGVLGALVSSIGHWQLLTLQGARGQTAEGMARRVAHLTSDASIAQADTVEEALTALINVSSADDLIVVFGSFYTVSMALEKMLAD